MSVCYLVTWKALNDQSDPSLWTPHFHYTPTKTCKVQGADKQNRHNKFLSFPIIVHLNKMFRKTFDPILLLNVSYATVSFPKEYQ